MPPLINQEAMMILYMIIFVVAGLFAVAVDDLT